MFASSAMIRNVRIVARGEKHKFKGLSVLAVLEGLIKGMRSFSSEIKKIIAQNAYRKPMKRMAPIRINFTFMKHRLKNTNQIKQKYNSI